MQHHWNVSLSEISLEELEVLLESQILKFPQINSTQIFSQHDLLIYFYQIDLNHRQNPKHDQQTIQSQLHSLVVKLLNDQMDIKTNAEVQTSQQNSAHLKFNNQEQQQSTQPHQHDVFEQESWLLSPLILRKIQSYFPKAYKLIKKQRIEMFSFSHSNKLIQLIELQIEDQSKFTDPRQIVQIVEHILLHLIFQYPQITVQCIDLVKSIMNYFEHDKDKKNQVTAQLSSIASKFYLKITHTGSTLSIQQVISILTAIQAIHCTSESYHPSLLTSLSFISHIKQMLLCSNVESKTANSIAVNIYGALLKQSNLYCRQSELFINLYSTLRSFGTHLIKDVWELFYEFIELEGNDLIFSKADLIDIIFYKIEYHENANVVKLCIQSILQEERALILFKRVPEAVYNSLIRILNYGMHYLDCLFHMDSKMFLMISNFFSRYFNNPQLCQNLEDQIRLFLRSMIQKITFDHAVVSLLNTFTLMTRKSRSVTPQVIRQIEFIISKYYPKNPIRKRHQIMDGVISLLKNHLSTKKSLNSMQETGSEMVVSLELLIQKCLLIIPDEYLTLNYNQKQKREEIYLIISENYTSQEINRTLMNYSTQANEILKGSLTQQNFNSLSRIIRSIQLIFQMSEQKVSHNKSQNIKCTFSNFSQQNISKLRLMYTSLYSNYVVDLGQSLYKTQKQRVYGIQIHEQLLSKIFVTKFLAEQFNMSTFIGNVLTNLSLLIKDYIEASQTHCDVEPKLLSTPTKDIFQIIYFYTKTSSETQSKQEEERIVRLGSQFLEWASDHIQRPECQLLIISAIKARQAYPKSSIDYIEESIYTLFASLFSVQSFSIGSSEAKISKDKILQIPPLNRLRLLTLCGSVLFSDREEMQKYFNLIVDNIEEIADRYDYQNLDEIFHFVQLVFTFDWQSKSKNEKKQLIFVDSLQQYVRISKLISSIVQTMLTSLNYGVDTKEVIACTSSVLNITFAFASKFHYFNSELVQLCDKILSVGEQYWMFERMMTFTLIQNLRTVVDNHKKIKFENMWPLVSRIICIQEYRGYDSAIALQPHLSRNAFYTQLKLTIHPDSDYEGTTCRLAFTQFLNQLIQRSMSNNENHHRNNQMDYFLQDAFSYLMSYVRRENREKMFLTGEHKVRLKHWQCLMVYSPKWVYETSLKPSSSLPAMENIVLDCIQMVAEHNLVEVKYYMELFLMKLLINDYSLKIVTVNVLEKLRQKLLELTAQVNKNTSFIVTSGLVITHFFRVYQVSKNHALYPSLERLYNALLVYSCSHVAYFRGLSQYFCLEKVYVKSEYSKILHQTIGQDPDTIILRDRLNIIINDYFEEIRSWNVRNNLFRQIPSLNRNIVSETYYIDRIKQLGQQLLRQIKGELGFVPYRQIWFQAVKSLNLACDNQIDIQKEAVKQQFQQQSIFQRKIDPSLDFIYFSKTKLEGFEMKILITGSKSIPIYGHLARTGQIFGLSELIVPYKQIAEDEEFKNVSCTAEKWLAIRQFSNKKQMINRQKLTLALQKQILKLKQQNYTFFLLKKHQDLTLQRIENQIQILHSAKKPLLILDQEGYLPKSIEFLVSEIVCFGKHFSQHVQASIFIWQYFRRIQGQKFTGNPASTN